MSRLYFGVESNLHPSDEVHPTPELSQVTFINPIERVIITLEGIECTWGVDEKNILSGRWKGIRSEVYNYDTCETIHDWEEMSDEDYEYLRFAYIKKTELFFDTECTYGITFQPALANMDISLEHGEHVKYWRSNVVPVEMVE